MCVCHIGVCLLNVDVSAYLLSCFGLLYNSLTLSMQAIKKVVSENASGPYALVRFFPGGLQAVAVVVRQSLECLIALSDWSSLGSWVKYVTDTRAVAESYIRKIKSRNAQPTPQNQIQIQQLLRVASALSVPLSTHFLSALVCFSLFLIHFGNTQSLCSKSCLH